MFERLLGLRNDVGLLSEEWDTGSRNRMVGNFPQALTHIAMTARGVCDHGRMASGASAGLTALAEATLLFSPLLASTQQPTRSNQACNPLCPPRT